MVSLGIISLSFGSLMLPFPLQGLYLLLLQLNLALHIHLRLIEVQLAVFLVLRKEIKIHTIDKVRLSPLKDSIANNTNN